MQMKATAILSSLALSSIIALTSYHMATNSIYATPLVGIDKLGTQVRQDQQPVEELTKAQKKEIECLAKNIYYEAAGEPRTGWLAVASVTLNRVLTGNYADTVCGVVYQKTGSTYQFSWVGMKNKMSKINTDVYNEIVDVATSMYVDYDSSKDVTKGSTFYHAKYVNPGWPYQRVKQIGAHIFYRAKVDYTKLGK